MTSRPKLSPGRYLVRLVLAAAAVFTVLVAVEAGCASAALVHPFITNFNGVGTPAGGMLASGVAVDNSSSANAGDLYVSDQQSDVIDRFSGLGEHEYLCQITGAAGLSTSLSECDLATPGPPTGSFSESGAAAGEGQDAVDKNGDFYAALPAKHAVDVFSPAGAYLSQIELPNSGEPSGVALDAASGVLIADRANSVIDRFDPVTKEIVVFTSGTPSGPLGALRGVAADNDPASPAYGDVYVTDRTNHVVQVYTANGEYLYQLTGTPSGAFFTAFDVAVDPSSGDVYVAAGRAVDEFSPAGAFITETPVPAGTFGLAVSATTGRLYVATGFQGTIEVFGPPVTIPDVSGVEVANEEPTRVTIDGQVDPAGGGEVISCQIEYGTSTAYGATAPCSPAVPYSTPTDVSAALAGLTPDTTYHFRMVARNVNGTVRSEDGVFETSGPPTVGEQFAGPVTRTAATLHAQIDPHALDTTYQVEYGETEAYGSTVPAEAVDIGSGVTLQEVTQSITGLAIGSTYYYRFVVVNSQGTVYGSGTFTVEPAVAVEDESWVAGPHEATLQARVHDFGTPTSCEVEYVTAAQYAVSGYTEPAIIQCTAAQLVGSEEALHVIARPHGLAVGTTYHFRFFLSNELGEQRSADQTTATFGLAAFSVGDLEQEGHPYTQAGGHPYTLTTAVDLATDTDHSGYVSPSGAVKDVRVQLPPGLIGDTQASAKCTRYDSEQQQCSGASQVGLIKVETVGNEPFQAAPLFNLAPPHGVAAELGARFSKLASAFIDAGVRTGSGYGIEADSLRITTLVPIVGVRVTLWGVPADSSHDQGRSCPEPGGYHYREGCSANMPLRPFLTNPTSCMGPLTASVEADTYQAPGEFAQLATELPGMTGCERVPFIASMTVKPESSAADSPTGLHINVHVPQNENPTGLAEANLRDATVTLPEGLTVNPASAGGLTGCSEAQIELHGPSPATCPNSSKIGTVELTSPLVNHPLKGAVYAAQQGNGGSAQGSNPFGSLLALYIAIDDEETGVVVKVAGSVALDPTTGRLTTTFAQQPQLPFEDLKLDFFGGPRAALVTPSVCGSSAASASLTSWAEPSSGVNPIVQPFAITSGPGGSPCPAGAFAPAFTAGTHSDQAGAFTPFVLSFSRQDGEPGMTGLETTLTPGLLAKLANIPLCGSTEAAAGTCPAASQIGTVIAAAGAGPDPIDVQGGIYLTGPYNGGPFGEVVEVPAVAGPFNLGTVVVRGAIRINPFTAQATVVSDPFPTMLQGVPLHLKRVAVTLDRPGFTLNPTNCDQLAITGTITGEHDASAPVSAPFQVANCATLPFKPSFAVSTQAKSSKAGGASLRVRIRPGAGANLAKIKVDLPRQLPSRLSTLQKACLAAVFAANSAACPAGSVVGRARAATPLLKTPFTGVAYLVSHGGAAFPDLEIVLKSEGITLIEDGKTDIKKGITSSTFNAIPDAPLTAFELVLPEGPHSALSAFLPATAKRSMCGQKLLMPTVITGQNGAVVKQTTKITATGCPKHKKAKAGRAGKKKG